MGHGRLKLSRPLAVYDIEATGLSVIDDRIVELAVIKLQLDGTRLSRVWRVHPGRPIPREATAVHGITDADVEDCPPFADVAGEVYGFFAGCDLGGYNIDGYDLPLLRAELQRAGQPAFPAEGVSIVDARSIFFIKEPRTLTAALSFYCDRRLEGAHSAHADAAATVDVLLGQLSRYDELPDGVEGLHKVCDQLRRDWLDEGRKLEWRDDAAVFCFGKHRGRPLRDVVQSDPDYLRWIVGKGDFHPTTKQICAEALKGQFPERSAAG